MADIKTSAESTASALTGAEQIRGVQSAANVKITATQVKTFAQIGTTTNDSASAGAVGEYVSSIIASGSAISLSTGASSNLTSISLTAGDWDVETVLHFTFGAATSYTRLIGSLSTTTASIDATADRYVERATAANIPGALSVSLSTIRAQFSLAGTTTVFSVANATFTVSTTTVWGALRARRIR